jgi:hypothetical protein
MKKKMYLVSVLLVAFTGMVMVAEFASCSKKDGRTASGGAKSNVVSSTPKREADGEYSIGSKVQVYNGDFEPMDAYFTYSPDDPTNRDYYDNAVILNFPPLNTLLFGKDTIAFVRYCIDKSIEWAATAKQNNVRALTKEILRSDDFELNDTFIKYMLKNQPRTAEGGDIPDIFLYYCGYGRNL